MLRTAKISSIQTIRALTGRLLRRRRRTSSCRRGALFAIVVVGLLHGPLGDRALYPGQEPPAPNKADQLRELPRQRPPAHSTAPEPVGFIRLFNLDDMLTEYLVQVTDDHAPLGDPEELKVTLVSIWSTANGKVLYDERQCCGFMRMVPLDNEERLLLTVWDRGSTARVLYIKGNQVKMVMNKSSINDWPQAIGNNGTVLIHQGRRLVGNVIYPTRTEIWQWNAKKEEFELKATVPYEHRYRDLAKFLDSK